MTPLAVSVCPAKGRDPAFEGTLIDSCFEGNGVALLVAFPLREAPPLRIAEKVVLALNAHEAEEHRVPARVVFEARDAQAFRCRFLAGLDARTLVASVLNRREALRVRPARAAPVEAIVRAGDGGEVRPAVNDVSVTGISLLLAHADERQLFEHWQLSLSLRFPEHDAFIDLVGEVRYRRLAGAAVYYGVEFDAGATAAFPGKQEVISRYVSLRQVETLAHMRSKRGLAG